jgi:hypothetical protein
MKKHALKEQTRLELVDNPMPSQTILDGIFCSSAKKTVLASRILARYSTYHPKLYQICTKR